MGEVLFFESAVLFITYTQGSTGGTNEKRSRNVRGCCFIPRFSPGVGNCKKSMRKPTWRDPEESNKLKTILDEVIGGGILGKNRTFLFPISLFWLCQFWFGKGEVEFSGDRDPVVAC